DLPHVLRCVRLGQVDRDHGRAADLLGELLEPVLAPRDQDQLDVRLTREPPRRGLADPARRAGDERHVGHRGTAYLGRAGQELRPSTGCVVAPAASVTATESLTA